MQGQNREDSPEEGTGPQWATEAANGGAEAQVGASVEAGAQYLADHRRARASGSSGQEKSCRPTSVSPMLPEPPLRAV